jgi:hypothetical protein
VFVQDAKNVSIPDYVDVVNDLHVIPGCTYKIVVESNPHNGKTNTSLKYTVPGKVNNIISRIQELKALTSQELKSYEKAKAEIPEERAIQPLTAQHQNGLYLYRTVIFNYVSSTT